MLSTAIQKDIGEYKAKLFAGLTVRTTVGLGLGIGLAALVIAVGFFAFGLSATQLSTPVMMIVGACFLASYTEPWGLPFEEAAPLAVRDLLYPSVITMKSGTELALEQIERDERQAKKSKQDKKEAKRHAKALRTEKEEIEDLADDGLCPERYRALVEQRRAELYGYEI